MELNFDSNVQQLETETGALDALPEEFLENLIVPEARCEDLSRENLPCPDDSGLAAIFNGDPEINREAELTPPSPLQQLLDRHLAWLHSEKQAGQQADLCRAIFSGSELTDANLREA